MIIRPGVFLFVFGCGLVTANLEDNIYLEGILHKNSSENALGVQAEKYPICEKGGSYTVPHEHYCDRYFMCSKGSPILKECMEGLAYSMFVGCRPLAEVDCSKRPSMHAPKGRCPRPDGLFSDKRGCGRYIRCKNGVASSRICPHHEMFDVYEQGCRRGTRDEMYACFPDLEYSSGFRCPDPETAVYPFGTHSRHPYPGNCRYFIMCLTDGSVKVSGCEDDEGFSAFTGQCEPAREVAACTHHVTSYLSLLSV